MRNTIGVVLFRKDLRITDNPALCHACKECSTVIPLYIQDKESCGKWYPGAAQQYWIHQSLNQLSQSIKKLGSVLTVRKGQHLDVLNDILDETGATTVYWNRQYEPALRESDQQLDASLSKINIQVKTYSASLLINPDKILTKSATPYKVFTPFWRTCQQEVEVAPPLKAPKKIPGPKKIPHTLGIDQLELEPAINWANGIQKHWKFGEVGAIHSLNNFVKNNLVRYSSARDTMSEQGTSTLSPYLANGEISARQIHFALVNTQPNNSIGEDSTETYLRQLFWREFSYYMLYHEPTTTEKPLHPVFNRFPWSQNKKNLIRWQQGQTGIPIIDAGMRELWHTGFMHNRVRMLVASYLTKNLMISWTAGASWFWDTLVDADLANNTFGWQWVAGCGADAAPYFRIFNPIRQSVRFDPDGDYIRKWVPELKGLATPYIHNPSDAPITELTDVGIILGENYPKSLVDLAKTRERALATYKLIR